MNYFMKIVNYYKLIFQILFIKMGKGKHPYEILRKQYSMWYHERESKILNLMEKYKNEYISKINKTYKNDNIEEQLDIFGDRFYHKAKNEILKDPQWESFNSPLKTLIENFKKITTLDLFVMSIPFAFFCVVIMRILMYIIDIIVKMN